VGSWHMLQSLPDAVDRVLDDDHRRRMNRQSCRGSCSRGGEPRTRRPLGLSR
jgi:hypothetical protein